MKFSFPPKIQPNTLFYTADRPVKEAATPPPSTLLTPFIGACCSIQCSCSSSTFQGHWLLLQNDLFQSPFIQLDSNATIQVN